MSDAGVTGAALLAEASRALGAAGIAGAPRDARLLLAHALGVAPGRLGLVARDPVTAGDAAAFRALVARRAARQPVSQITGARLFWGRSFQVTRDVLDPRPETETLISEALEQPFSEVLDLGTGTGCILLTLLAECPSANGLGTDASAAALGVAAANRAALGLDHRALLSEGDWWAAVPETARFDLIVSNPPYIAAAEMSGLAPELFHEPAGALTDGADGLTAYRAIAGGAARHLAPSGRLLLEIGATQASAVCRILAVHGLPEAAVRCDLDGRDRVISVERR